MVVVGQVVLPRIYVLVRRIHELVKRLILCGFLGGVCPEFDHERGFFGRALGYALGGDDLFRGLAMNLKQGGGRVPIRDDDGYRLVPWR